MSEKPKWQKARQIRTRPEDTEEGRGRVDLVFWISGAPKLLDGIGTTSYSPRNYELRYCTNVRTPDGTELIVAADVVELLPEFTDNPPFVTWEQFLRGDS